MIKNITDNEVIDAVLNQDRSVLNDYFKFFYQSYFPPIRNYIQQNSGLPEEANDIFQDALVIFYVKVKKGEYSRDSSLKTYLFGISRNLWLKELRRRRTATKHEVTPDEEADFQSELFIQESQMTIRKVLEYIDEECKRLLLDFYYNGKRMSELTVQYSLGSEAAAKNKKYRCLQKLVNLVRRQKLGRSDFSNG